MLFTSLIGGNVGVFVDIMLLLHIIAVVSSFFVTDGKAAWATMTYSEISKDPSSSIAALGRKVGVSKRVKGKSQ